jgi:hypothetical protein
MNNRNLQIGILGMVMLLAAFGLNLTKIMTESDLLYIWLNIAGAGLSTYYAATLKAWPFIILESVWCGFAIYKLVTVLLAKS